MEEAILCRSEDFRESVALSRMLEQARATLKIKAAESVEIFHLFFFFYNSYIHEMWKYELLALSMYMINAWVIFSIFIRSNLNFRNFNMEKQ